MIELLRRFLTEDELQKALSAPRKDRTHPVNQIKKYRDNNGYIFYNTEFALKNVLTHNFDWLKSKSTELTNVDEYTSASSVLGEIRAYGYLLGAGFEVVPLKETETPTPDFHVKNGEGEIVEIEVNSKQFTSGESTAQEEFTKNITVTPQKQVVISEHVVTPFGKPKDGENVTENVISKIASIKQKEHQFSDGCPSILWLDFQDEIWWSDPKADSALPIRTWREEFYSGELWYGFYGKKGMLIYEGDSIEVKARKASIKMRHGGRYRYQSKIDACIVSLKNDLIILENPFSKNPLPGWFVYKLTMLRWFNMAYSWLNWPEDNLNGRIENEINRLDALSKIKLYRW